MQAGNWELGAWMPDSGSTSAVKHQFFAALFRLFQCRSLLYLYTAFMLLAGLSWWPTRWWPLLRRRPSALQLRAVTYKICIKITLITNWLSPFGQATKNAFSKSPARFYACFLIEKTYFQPFSVACSVLKKVFIRKILYF